MIEQLFSKNFDTYVGYKSTKNIFDVAYSPHYSLLTAQRGADAPTRLSAPHL